MSDHVTITVDGEPVALPAGEHGTLYVLTASGLTMPSRYDLARIDRDGALVVTHRAGDTVVVADGDEFVAVRIDATT